MEDNELRQAMVALESYKTQLDALAQQSRMLQMSLEESLRSKETIKALIEAEPGDEILVPAGGAAFITVTVSKKKKAIIGIGSGYSLEKELDDAISFIDGNIEEIKEAAKSLSETAARIEETATKLSLTVNQEIKKRQG